MKTTDDYKDYLNVHEFYEIFWDKVPENLISNMYLDENEDFIRETTFSLYEEYLEDRLSINLAAKILTEIIKSLFKYKPRTSNIVDNKYE